MCNSFKIILTLCIVFQTGFSSGLERKQTNYDNTNMSDENIQMKDKRSDNSSPVDKAPVSFSFFEANTPDFKDTGSRPFANKDAKAPQHDRTSKDIFDPKMSPLTDYLNNIPDKSYESYDQDGPFSYEKFENVMKRIK